MISKKLVLVLAVCIALLTTFVVQAVVGTQTNQSQALVVEIAEEAIKAEGLAQVNSNSTDVFAGKYAESYRDLVLNKIASQPKEIQGTYSGYNSFFVLRSAKIFGRSAIVNVMEHGILPLANPENDPGVPPKEEYVYEHEVRLALDKDAWRVVDDRLTNLPGRAAPSPGDVPLPHSTLPIFFKNQKPEPQLKTSSYNASTAVAYARLYATTYNSGYRSWSPDDCTNFVSQAVRAGGWTAVYGSASSYACWWYDSPSSWSATWVRAQGFGQFVHNRPRANIAAYISDLRIGDVLQADWDGDGTIDHTMIVTAKSGTEIYLTYHSVDRLDQPFSTILATHQNATWYGHLMYSSFN